MAETIPDTRRLNSKPQTLNDAYGPPSNFLEIDVRNPETVGVGRGRFTTYEIRLKTNLPIFKLKESRVRRRYSDFEWLRDELERESKVVVPPLPGKAIFRQLPFRGDDGIFDDSFIENGGRPWSSSSTRWRDTPWPRTNGVSTSFCRTSL
ncbi:hypothetical protein ANANG_G00115790 [Anguilla anguilla]|uniref:PX domain-containing protein n=1 Tax=Anguilla anguilla TaxID=7936 RepID=A0A9D3MCL4_ANGAN|nr:hypothetical protein ANANG_G00115790 [Anguilla anguilla]